MTDRRVRTDASLTLARAATRIMFRRVPCLRHSCPVRLFKVRSHRRSLDARAQLAPAALRPPANPSPPRLPPSRRSLGALSLSQARASLLQSTGLRQRQRAEYVAGPVARGPSPQSATFST